MRLFTDVASSVDDPYLRRACVLAEHARGATSPNPLVGCVIVRDGAVVGEGYHPRAGEPHAEVFALAHAGDAARGADAYVTLEPCAHHGRTPPCADALIEAGVRRVVIGMPDPNPIAGGGVERLRVAGIEVVFAQDPAPFRELNEGWLKRIAEGRPLVVAKLGLTMDAHLAFERATPAVITGSDGAAITRRLRSRADAVVVGAMTVIADDPALTARDADGRRSERQPLRVVVARSFLPGPDARVFTDGHAPTLVLAPHSMPEANLLELPTDVLVERYDESKGFSAALDILGARGLSEVLVEPGPRLFSSLTQEDAIDYLVAVTRGGMAGEHAPALYTGEPDRDADALIPMWKPAEAGVLGEASVTTWRRAGADMDW